MGSNKKPTQQELEAKVEFYEQAIAEMRKEARKALTEAGIWDQAFHENEINAVTMVFKATRSALESKTKAMHIALDFIGKYENDYHLSTEVYEVLDKINKLIAGESLDEAMKKR